jgi:hypothetical protein
MALASSAIGDFFGHPFVVVVTSALLAGFVVNYFTHKWQESLRERELKTDLVASMSESVHTFTMSVLFEHQAKKPRSAVRPTQDILSKRQADLEAAYHCWRVSSAVIGVKLEAYFSATSLRDEWSKFSKAVNHFYRLEGADAKTQNAIYAKLWEALPALSVRDAVESELAEELPTEEDKAWVDAKHRINEETSSLVKKVLGSDVSP